MGGRRGSSRMLSALIAQAQQQGASWGTLQAIVEEASELGASRALDRLGLSDDEAGTDIHALRNLLDAWRDARRIAWHTFIKWIATLLLTAIVIGVTLRLHLWPPNG